MDVFWRKKYRKDAALWAAEGKLAMSVQPKHLLALLDEYRPPPQPHELQSRLDVMARELVGLQGKLRLESERANAAHAIGHAKAVRENGDEVKRLRAEVAQLRARNQTYA